MESVFSFRRVCVTVIVFCIVVITCTACDPNANRRPNAYRPSTWICEEPYICIQYGEKGEQAAEIMINGEIQSCDVYFNFGSRVNFRPHGSNQYADVFLEGDCKFSAKKLVVHVEKDTLYNSRYETLVFFRQMEE